MSVLSGPEIARLIAAPDDAVPRIRVDPFDPGAVGTNSLDLRLAPRLLTYRDAILDAAKENETGGQEIPERGLVLWPGVLYLGSTVERVGAWGLVPCIETRSSFARLGLSAHLSAGFGDSGFNGTWVLEITVVHPLRIYAGCRICQVAFTTLEGERREYAGKYRNQSGAVASRAHLDADARGVSGG